MASAPQFQNESGNTHVSELPEGFPLDKHLFPGLCMMAMQNAFSFPDRIETSPPPLPKVEYDIPDLATWNGLVLVGEAPGADEVRLGRPFVGRSGQLLDKILIKAGIERKHCFVANVFRYQPPGNKIDHFFISRRAAKQQGVAIAEDLGQFGSSFCRQEFAVEIEHLRSTLEKIKQHHPKMMLMALGRTPLWALTGENGLLSKVGKPLPCGLLPGVEVIPTFHPSFILRGNWKLQDEWLNHFLLAKKYIL